MLNARKAGVGCFPALIVCLTLVVAAQGRQTKPEKSLDGVPPDLMGIADIHGWIVAGTPRILTKEGLPGYAGGGAEIFLQYGFRNVTLFQLIPKNETAPKKSITLEIYRMESPAAAFGIFSTGREGDEPASPGIRTIHWVVPEQANLVKGDLYINIVASGCTRSEIEDFTVSLARGLPPTVDAPLPPAFSCMPEFNLVPGTERYICGDVAASKETPLLGADFWGFKEGLAEAYSAKYGPEKSKLVLVEFKKAPENLFDNILGQFNSFLTSITMIDQVNRIMQGTTVLGRRLYFGVRGLHVAIVLDEPDTGAAQTRIEDALDRAARLQKGGTGKSNEP